MNRLQELQDIGVSIWLDTLSRELLETGAFAALVDESAVTGATSNPTIFAKAITASARYDDQLRSLAAAGTTDPRELFFAVALDDVRAAAAILRPAFERRVAAGEPVDPLASVASFFVSRVDAKADAVLAPASPLRGEVAIANAHH